MFRSKSVFIFDTIKSNGEELIRGNSFFPIFQDDKHQKKISFFKPIRLISSIQFSSVAQMRPTLCDPMNRSTPGLPVHHQLQEFTQTHMHRVSDAIQPFHPLSSHSPCPQSLPASGSFPMSQLFPWGGQSIGVSALASVLPKNTQDWSPLGWYTWSISTSVTNTFIPMINTHVFFQLQCHKLNHNDLPPVLNWMTLDNLLRISISSSLS